MKTAVIEIGTNSTKLIISEINKENDLKVIEKTSTVNRLSKSMYGRKTLCENAMDNGLKIIGEYLELCKKSNARVLSIISTSVLRDAANAQDFIRMVKEKYGIEIEVISGEKEATLAFKACCRLISNSEKKIAVIDIGGGSTEISFGNGDKIFKKFSIDIGAVRLAEMYVKSDPIKAEEIDNIVKHVSDALEVIDTIDFLDCQFIGTGGTIKTVGTILLKEDYKNERAVHGHLLQLKDIQTVYDLLIKCANDEKRSIIGLNPKRADVINAGVIVLLSIMEKFKINCICVSSYGVIEGFIEEYHQCDFNGIL